MELVEGDDLAQVLKSGPLPVDDAINVAKQIAEGLEEAHEHGIVHRDLKPANVKRTPDGKVKILDFGLAMALAGKSTAEEESVTGMATLTAAVTQAGMVMGTAAYMSPEQARGLAVDRRTDIWAFGVILFEMLTGRRLFEGETITDTLAGILKTDPDWSTLPDGTPPQVERVLRRCLTRNARQRLRDIGEARVRLEEPEAESGFFTGAVRPVADEPRSPLRVLPWALLVVAVAAAGGFAFYGRGGPADVPLIQLAVPAPPDTEFQLNSSYPALPAISPDGRYVVFGAHKDGEDGPRLYLRSLAASDAVALDGTLNAQYPFWSPDSKWIAFFDRNEGLKKVPLNGGPDQVICAAQNAKGGTWNRDGVIVFAPDFQSGLMKVPALGGEPEPVTDLAGDDGFDSHRHPWFLPDGRRFLYLARGTAQDRSELRLASLDGDSTRVVMPHQSGVEFAGGRLLYLRKQVLMARVFDPDRCAFTSDPVPVASDVLMIGGAAKAAFSVSQNGSLLVMRGGEVTMSGSMAWMDRRGVQQEEIPELAPYNTVVLSPDEKFVAVTVWDGTRSSRDLWIYEFERAFNARFTSDRGDEYRPLWSPDGARLYYIADREGYYKVYRRAVNGTEADELVLDAGSDALIWDISADERYLLYSVMGEGTGNDLWLADLTGAEEPRLLRGSPQEDAAAHFSPDGRWISYWSMETGSGQVYLAPWPSMSYTRRVSTSGGAWQLWSADSRELVFQDGDGKVYACSIEPDGDGVKIGAPQPLFDHGGVSFDGPRIGMTGDAQRFLGVMSVDTTPPGYIDVVIGWPELLPQE